MKQLDRVASEDAAVSLAERTTAPRRFSRRRATTLLPAAFIAVAMWSAACGGAPPPESASAEGRRGLPKALAADWRAEEVADKESADEAQPQSWRSAMKMLVARLAENLNTPADSTLRVAVLDVTTPAGDICPLSAPVAEDLTTHLFGTPRLSIIERRMLGRILQENAAAQSDFFDPGQVARLGRLVGADAVVTGTLAAAAHIYTLNARIILVESAEVASVAQVDIPRAIAEERGRCRPLPKAPPPRPTR